MFHERQAESIYDFPLVFRAVTRRSDPHSLQSAWRETGRLLGWEYLAEEISRRRIPNAGKVNARQIQRWCDEDKYPPVWALEVGDIMLKANGHPQLNHLAYKARIGADSQDLKERLSEIDHELLIAGQLIDSSRDDAISALFHDLVSTANGGIRLLADMIGRLCLRHERWREEEARRRDQEPPAGPPKLREIAGGRP
jgi:hypothetical protein